MVTAAAAKGVLVEVRAPPPRRFYDVCGVRGREGGEKEHVTDHNVHQLDSNLEIHMQKKFISSQYSHGLSQEEDWAEGRGSFGFTSLSH